MSNDRADALGSAVPSYTPGPWFVVTHGSGTWTIQDREYGAGRCIAQSYGKSDAANGHLIAAAPDMYEALRAHDRYMRETGRYSGPEDSALHPEAAKNWRRILDVLSQATAKQERKS